MPHFKEISIKIFGYCVKFNVRKKKKNKSMGFTETLFFYRGWTWKNWRTAMANGAIDREK